MDLYVHSVTTIFGTFVIVPPTAGVVGRGIRTTVIHVHRCANAPGMVMSRLDNWHDGSCGEFIIGVAERLAGVVGFWRDTTKGSMDPAGADVVVRTLSLLGCDLGRGGSAIFLNDEVDAASAPSVAVVVSSVLLRLEVYGFITVVLPVGLVNVDDDDDAMLPTKVRPSPSKTVRADATMDA